MTVSLSASTSPAFFPDEGASDDGGDHRVSPDLAGIPAFPEREQLPEKLFHRPSNTASSVSSVAVPKDQRRESLKITIDKENDDPNDGYENERLSPEESRSVNSCPTSPGLNLKKLSLKRVGTLSSDCSSNTLSSNFTRDVNSLSPSNTSSCYSGSPSCPASPTCSRYNPNSRYSPTNTRIASLRGSPYNTPRPSARRSVGTREVSFQCVQSGRNSQCSSDLVSPTPHRALDLPSIATVETTSRKHLWDAAVQKKPRTPKLPQPAQSILPEPLEQYTPSSADNQHRGLGAEQLQGKRSAFVSMWASNTRIPRSRRVTPVPELKKELAPQDGCAETYGLPGRTYDPSLSNGPVLLDAKSKAFVPPDRAARQAAFKVKKSSDEVKVRRSIETLYFRDNLRQVDYVLVYKDGEDLQNRQMRKMYEQNLVHEGLELEKEDKSESQDGLTYYVKVHCPQEILTRYAEILKIKKPVKTHKDDPHNKTELCGMKNPFLYNENIIPPEPTYFYIGFSMKKVDQFIIKTRDPDFTPAQRSQITWEILAHTKFSNEEDGMGINHLISQGTYKAAFVLHDGRYDRNGPDGNLCDRRKLYLEWASFRNFYKKQPINLVRRYYGAKMAMYFAWLGFYTEMLIPAAIIGVFTFMCGLFFMNSDYNKPSDEICQDPAVYNLTMCPLCDRLCGFWKLKDSCFLSRLTFLFDNPVTVFFSIAMSFWATLYLEFWKRRQTVLQWQWDLENYEEEEVIRPDFQTKVKTTRINPVTNKVEPYIPLLHKLGRQVAVNTLILLMVFLMLAAVMSVMIYRMAVAVAFYSLEGTVFARNAKFVASITSAMLNLVVIVSFNYIYRRVVTYLTDLECPRTETEYDDSFTLKMFLFQFINFYSSLIYIAFIKGRMFYHPGESDNHANVFVRMRYDLCDPTGCLPELCVQLIVIMIGRQMLANFMEIAWPMVQVRWNKFYGHDNSANVVYTRWEQDYDLAPFTRLSLFDEYLEMVIQYGFVTLFVAAFPLAPLFALINNVVELRLDAYKYLTEYRRPRAERIQDIGIWFNILRVMTYIAVLSNALVISSTSDFIPRLVYMFGYSPDNTLTGYTNNSLSIFNTSDYEPGTGPDPVEYPEEWPPTCRYRAYRYPPGPKQYGMNLQFWHVFTARLAFIFFFEHLVFVLTGFLSYFIPDVPQDVKVQIMREQTVERETLFDTHLKQYRNERYSGDLEGPRTRSPSLDETMSLRSHSSPPPSTVCSPRRNSNMQRTP